MKYTIHDLHEQLVKKEISAVELTKKIIAHRDSVEGDIHAYLSTSDESALSVAAKVDAKIAAGEEISDLAGIPGAIKDNMCIKGETCTAASRMLEHWVSPYALGFSRQQNIKLRALLQQRFCAGNAQFGIAQHDKGSNGKLIADLADWQFTAQAGHFQMVGRHRFISSFFHDANC